MLAALVGSISRSTCVAGPTSLLKERKDREEKKRKEKKRTSLFIRPDKAAVNRATTSALVSDVTQASVQSTVCTLRHEHDAVGF